MKTLFLHVGAGKTGSTAIQYHLHANADTLAGMGVSVPLLDVYYPGRGPTDYMGNGEFLVAEFVHGEQGANRQLYDRFLKVCASTNSTTIIVSCEMLEFAARDKLDMLRAAMAQVGVAVKVIYILRDLIPHAVSFWLQVVKNHGETRSWAKFASDFQSPFARSLVKFQDVFGPDAVLTGKYHESNRDDVIATFYDLIGIPVDRLTTVDATYNLSLGSAAAEVALVINGQQYLTADKKRELIRMIHNALRSRRLDPRFDGRLSNEQRRAFEERHATDMSVLRRHDVDWGWSEQPTFSD